MTFQSTMAADLAFLHADTSGPAESVTYTPKNGAVVPMRVPFSRVGRDEQQFPDGMYEIETAQTVVLLSLVPTVTLLEDKMVVTPVSGSGSETWYVRQIYFENAAARELQMMRQVRKRMVGETTELSRALGGAARRGI